MAFAKHEETSDEETLTPNLKTRLKGQVSEQAALRTKTASRKKKSLAIKEKPTGDSTQTQTIANKKKSPEKSARPEKLKKELTAAEATMLAWQDTYKKQRAA